MDMSAVGAWIGRTSGRLWVEISSALTVAVEPLMVLTFWWALLFVPACVILGIVIWALSRRNRVASRRAGGGRDLSQPQVTAFGRRAKHLSIALIGLICVAPVTGAVQSAALGLPLFVMFMALFDILSATLVVTLVAVALDILRNGRVAGRDTLAAGLTATLGGPVMVWTAYAATWVVAYAFRAR